MLMFLYLLNCAKLIGGIRVMCLAGCRASETVQAEGLRDR